MSSIINALMQIANADKLNVESNVGTEGLPLPFEENFTGSEPWEPPADPISGLDYPAPSGWRYMEYEYFHPDQWGTYSEFNWHKNKFDDQASHYGNPGWATKGEKDSWLITPLINIPSEGNYSLFFKELIDGVSDYMPNMEVRISTNGSYSKSDFLANDALYNASIDDIDVEREIEIDLSAYAGDNVYIAFVYQIPAQEAKNWNIYYVKIK